MLKDTIKEIIGFILRFSGLLIIREIFCKNKVRIIVYHDPSPDVFKKHIKYLYKQFNFISLSRLINAIHNKDWSNIPAKSLVITIDDGHKDNYELLDIFKTYNINPTIYLCSQIVSTKRRFWWKTGCARIQELKRLPHNLMLDVLRDEVNYWPEKEYKERQALSLAELVEMSPYVDFGSHTEFHPILPNCTEKKCRDEIENSKIFLEKLLCRPIEHFCYPNGNYSEREIEFVMRSGYKSARTLDCGYNDMSSNPYSLKAMEIQDNATINILCGQINGFFQYLRSIKNRIYNNSKIYVTE